MVEGIIIIMTQTMEFTLRQLGQKNQEKCYNCKKMDHYSNEYDEEMIMKTSNKKVSKY